MSENFYIELTLAVYKVTGLFPDKEPLKYDIRQSANEILVNLITHDVQNISQNIKALQDLFSLAGAKNLADSRNFVVLRREYGKISKFMQDRGVSSGKTVEKSFFPKNRKEEILQMFKQNGKVKIGDLARTFPGLNRRTLLRDLDGFCQLGLVEKNGNGRGACYTIRNATL